MKTAFVSDIYDQIMERSVARKTEHPFIRHFTSWDVDVLFDTPYQPKYLPVGPSEFFLGWMMQLSEEATLKELKPGDVTGQAGIQLNPTANRRLLAMISQFTDIIKPIWHQIRDAGKLIGKQLGISEMDVLKMTDYELEARIRHTLLNGLDVPFSFFDVDGNEENPDKEETE